MAGDFWTLCLLLGLGLGRCLIKCDNEFPIIGVIAEETANSSKGIKYGNSHIVASYVKFLESGGARVVPVMIYQSEEYYENLMNRLNGILFTGGGNYITSDGYGRTASIIVNIAKRLNKKNDYFPIWGTCLGFEFLLYKAFNKSYFEACSAEDVASPIELYPSARNSRIFRNVTDELIFLMQERPTTINYHQWCLTVENYTKSGMKKFYNALATSRDANGSIYISVIEANEYPFYGVAFHPEKVLFEWPLSKAHHNIPHTQDAVKVSQYFANFFVNEARKSSHHFSNKTEEINALIYNHSPVFTGKLGSSEMQNYYFHVHKGS